MSNTVRLSDVVVKNTGTRNPLKQAESEFIYIDVASVDNQSKRITQAKQMVSSAAPSRARKVVRAGDVIVSTIRPNLNAVALVPHDLDGQIASTGFCVLRAEPHVVLPEYLFYFVRSKAFVDGLTQLVAGAMYPAVTDGQVLEQCIRLPSLQEQRRIVDFLSRAEGIVHLRRLAQAKTQAIIPALFLDMFGDPAFNTKGWPSLPLSDLLVSIDSGKSPKCHDRPRGNDEWGVLRLGAVTSCEYDESEHKTLPADISVNRAIEVHAGDLILSRKNTSELVGASAYVWATSGRMLLPDLIFRLRTRDPTPVDSIYLWKLLTSKAKRRALARLATGSADSMPNISKERLRTLPVELPPFELQLCFAGKVRQIRAISIQQALARQKSESAFNALLARAFPTT